MLLKILKQRFSEILTLLGMSVFGYIFGEILLVVIMRIDQESTTFEIATMMVAIIALVSMIIMGIFQFPSQFNMAVGMGVVRKVFVPCYYLSNVLIAAVQYGMIVAAHYLENMWIQKLYPNLEKEAGIEQILFTNYTIPVILMLAAIQIMAGCCILKFGKKAFWILWAVWMLLCIAPARISDVVENNPEGNLAVAIHGIGSFFQSVSVSSMNVVILMVTVVCLVSSWLLARRQQVTNL